MKVLSKFANFRINLMKLTIFGKSVTPSFYIIVVRFRKVRCLQYKKTQLTAT